MSDYIGIVNLILIGIVFLVIIGFTVLFFIKKKKYGSLIDSFSMIGRKTHDVVVPTRNANFSSYQNFK